MTRQDAVKIPNGVWRGLPKETVDAFAKTANGSARTLAKLISSVNKIMALNGIKTPDAEAAAAAAGETLKMNGFLYRTAVWINDFGERAGISALVCIPRE